MPNKKQKVSVKLQQEISLEEIEGMLLKATVDRNDTQYIIDNAPALLEKRNARIAQLEAVKAEIESKLP